MRATRFLVAALLCSVLAAPAVAGHHESDLLAELTALGDKLSTAMVEKDFETALAMYTEDAISLPNYGPRMQGVEAFRQHHELMSSMGMEILSFESAPTEAWESGDHVIEIGNFEIALEMPGMPGTIKDKGKYMTVYVRSEDGSLKIKAETWNTDMNPMMMGGMGGEHPEGGEPSEGGG